MKTHLSLMILALLLISLFVIGCGPEPMSPPTAIPTEELARHPLITALVTDRGGHVGFVAGNGWLRPLFWAERTVATWLAERLVT